MGLLRRLRGRRTADESDGGSRRQRGVTVVEYALVVTFLVASSAVAVNYLRTGLSSEVDNTADCVQSRPPVGECQIEIATTTTSTTLAPTTSTTSGPTSTTTCPPPPGDPPCPTTTTTVAPPNITFGSITT